MSRTPPVAVAAASFGLLGAASGYVAASVYVTHRFGGSVANLDLLYLGRNLLLLQERAPREFLIVMALVGAGALLGAMIAGVLGVERLTRFGVTAWQTRREIKRNGFLSRPETGFILAKLGEPGDKAPFLVSKTFPHALLIAPTGRGKTAGFIVPNMLSFAGSVVCLDVKGEVFKATARRRQGMGDRVIRFAPGDWGGQGSHRYNPLHRIAGLKDLSQQMMELRLTAGLFLQNDSPAMAGLLQGGIDIFVAAGMLAIERKRPTLGEIYRIAVGGGDKQRAYAHLAEEVRYAPARLMFENLASINDKTLTSYLSLLLTSGLHLWANPAIDAVTAATDFNFREIRRHPTAVYLDVGLRMLEPLAPLIRLFFSDLIASLQSQEPQEDERFRVMILLDEFDKLGRMPVVAESIKTLRSYSAHLAIVSQSIPGIDDIYGENTRLSLQAGAGVKVYLTPSDRKTIGELSASLGRTTKRIVSKSRPLGPHTLRSRSLTERTEDAPLLTEDEVRMMDLDDVVIVLDAMNPIRARRIEWFKDRTLKAVADRYAGPLPFPEPPAEDEAPPPEDDDPTPPAAPPGPSGAGPDAQPKPRPQGGPAAVRPPQGDETPEPGPSSAAPQPSVPATAARPATEAPAAQEAPSGRRGVLRRGVTWRPQIEVAYLAPDEASGMVVSLHRFNAPRDAEEDDASPEHPDEAASRRRPWLAGPSARAVTPDPSWGEPASVLALRDAIMRLKTLAEPSQAVDPEP